MNKKRIPHVYTVEFTSHQIPGTRRHYRHYEPFQVTVEATGVEDALRVASKKSLTHFIHKIPKEIANICWARDSSYEGTGYIAVQYPRGQKLSAPYMMTKRLNVTVTLGNIPVQLCFDFGE